MSASALLPRPPGAALQLLPVCCATTMTPLLQLWRTSCCLSALPPELCPWHMRTARVHASYRTGGHVCGTHTQQCSCRDVHGDAREALKDAQLGGSECQICHAVVSYVRAALSNDETKKEIELVRASPSITLPLEPLGSNATFCSATFCSVRDDVVTAALCRAWSRYAR